MKRFSEILNQISSRPMPDCCFISAFHLKVSIRARESKILIVLALVVASLQVAGATDSTTKVSADFPHFNDQEKMVEDIYFAFSQPTKGTLSFDAYIYRTDRDSLHVFGQRNLSVALPAGPRVEPLSFGPNDANSFVHPTFYHVLRQCGAIPAGSYRIYLSFDSDSGKQLRRVIQLQADSQLSAVSSINGQLNELLSPGLQTSLRNQLQPTILNSATPAAKTVSRNAARIDRLFRSRGLSPQLEERDGKSMVNLWFEDWFIGRYELEARESAASQIRAQQARVTGNISSLASNELGSYRSLFSQIRELTKSNKEEKELSGELSVSGQWSNGQPEYCAQDNNYYEVRGQIETEAMDIPISLEGYYTTQDAHRQIKGSYIHAHYDADKAKAKLMKLITGYRNQFNQTVAKGKGLDQVYGSYLNTVEGSKERLLRDLKRDAGLNVLDGQAINADNLQAQIEEALLAKMNDTAALLNSAESRIDSSGRIKHAVEKMALIKDSATKLYARAMKRYEEVKALEATYHKYKSLLEQYKNTTYFDSALVYDKIRSLENGDEVTYKQLAKSASDLLPEGKAKKFVTGLTSLDAGIFSRYVSKYTMGGQQLTGLDLGYDIGFAQIGVGAGSTQYVGRNGTLDKYNSLSSRITFKPFKGQKAGLVYYGYTPSKSMFQGDDFYVHSDIALPSFKEPVSIVSATYEGNIADAVTINGELATSFRKGTGQTLINGLDAERLAWHLNAEGQIPKTLLALTGSYEHGGQGFQNSTLPMMISGTDLYKVGLKGDFFRSFLTAGIEYNHMEQDNFYSKGGNNRWGFELATHSRQYPAVSLSYKPFATFRALNDTMNVPQRPLQGAVWTGKAAYQFKRTGGISYRFSAIFNRSTSARDTLTYRADLIQLNAAYTSKILMATISVGQSQQDTRSGGQPQPDSLYPAHIRTTFFMASGSRSFSKTLSINAGADIGFAAYGLSKYGLNGGLNYKMPKVPLSARMTARYNAYKLPGYSGNVATDMNGTGKQVPLEWRQLISGSLEFIWQFRMKLNH